MFHIVLYQPEIPPNTGNIMRLCVNGGFKLHIIEPMGFTLQDKQLRRAGLDYIDPDMWRLYPDFEAFVQQVNPNKIYCCTTKASAFYTEPKFEAGDALVFGPETRGLPMELMDQYPENQKIKIPMTEKGRSLNLATAVAIIGFEAWRQNHFLG